MFNTSKWGRGGFNPEHFLRIITVLLVNSYNCTLFQ